MECNLTHKSQHCMYRVKEMHLLMSNQITSLKVNYNIQYIVMIILVYLFRLFCTELKMPNRICLYYINTTSGVSSSHEFTPDYTDVEILYFKTDQE